MYIKMYISFKVISSGEEMRKNKRLRERAIGGKRKRRKNGKKKRKRRGEKREVEQEEG